MNTVDRRKLRRGSRVLLTGVCGASLLMVSCVPGVVGGTALVAFFLGRLVVSFSPGTTSSAVSDSSGDARIELEGEPGSYRIRSYEGVLPGFVESGTTQVLVDLDSGRVIGDVTTPEGARSDLAGVLPGLSARPSDAGLGFAVNFAEGGLQYEYEMRFIIDDGQELGQELIADVIVTRVTIDGAEVIIDDRGRGTFRGGREDTSGRPRPLDPAPPPVIIDAGPDLVVTQGDSIMLLAEVRSANDDFSARWSPTPTLDDASELNPTAAPNSTLTYTLTVTDSIGQQAIDVVTVTVIEPLIEALVVDAGPDLTIEEGQAVSLQPTVSGGNGNYQFSWSPAAGLSDSGALAPSASPTQTTMYTLVVVDGRGAMSMNTMTVVVVPRPEFTITNSGLRETEPSSVEREGCAYADLPGAKVVFEDPDEFVVYYFRWEDASSEDSRVVEWRLPDGSTRTSESSFFEPGGGCAFSSAELGGGIVSEGGNYEARLLVNGAVFDARTFEYRTVPEDALGTIRGIVTDVDTGLPQAGALVRFDRSPDAPIEATSGADGTYVLFAPKEVPKFFALSASLAGYIPETANIETATLTGTTLFLDFELQRERLDTIPIELVPVVHHLGDDSFGGVINSQFQKSSEGPEFVTTFSLTADQLAPDFNSATLVGFAKGTQSPINDIVVNGLVIGSLCCAPTDGSFGTFELSIPFEILAKGTNVFLLRSGVTASNPNDIDDFEFVNVQILLSP